MPRCPDCDELVSAGQKECPSCGAAIKRTGGKSQGVSIIVIVACVIGFCMLTGGVLGVALLLPAVQSGRDAARISQSRNNLKQIGLAMHNYHDVMKRLPPGSIYSQDDVAQNGWMAMLLPYVEQAPLYNQIDFGQPWNSPRNQPAYRNVVPIYLHPGIPEKLTADGYGESHYSGNSQTFVKNRALGFSDFLDGMSNTMIVGEISGGLPAWGLPDNTRDLALGLGNSSTQFGSPSPRGTQILMGDGAVRLLNSEVSPDVLKALSTHRDGENINLDF